MISFLFATNLSELSIIFFVTRKKTAEFFRSISLVHQKHFCFIFTKQATTFSYWVTTYSTLRTDYLLHEDIYIRPFNFKQAYCYDLLIQRNIRINMHCFCCCLAIIMPFPMLQLEKLCNRREIAFLWLLSRTRFVAHLKLIADIINSFKRSDCAGINIASIDL